MIQFAFLLAIVFGGIAVLTPIVGLTAYMVLKPWLSAYTARQNALAAGKAYEREDRQYARQGVLAAGDSHEWGTDDRAQCRHH